jgi:hypothetical protein
MVDPDRPWQNYIHIYVKNIYNIQILNYSVIQFLNYFVIHLRHPVAKVYQGLSESRVCQGLPGSLRV